MRWTEQSERPEPQSFCRRDVDLSHPRGIEKAVIASRLVLQLERVPCLPK